MVSNDFVIDPLPMKHMSPENNTKLRQMRMRNLTLHDPSILQLSVAELRNLGNQARQFALDCGPMDLAYPHFAGTAKVYDTVAFLKECETRGISRDREVALARFVPILGSDIFDLTSLTALDRAQMVEEDIKSSRLPPPLTRRMSEKVNAYVELGSVLERWEQQACPIAA